MESVSLDGFSLCDRWVTIPPLGRCARVSYYLVTSLERPTLLPCIGTQFSFLLVRLRHAAAVSPCCVTLAFPNKPYCIVFFCSWRAFGLFPAVVGNATAGNILLLNLKNIYLAKTVYAQGTWCDDLMHSPTSLWNVSYWTYVCVPIMGWSCWDREHIFNFSRCCQIVFQKCLYQFTLPPVSVAVPFILDSINF